MQINYSIIRQTLFNAAAGGILSFIPGSIGTHIVRWLEGQSLHAIPSYHPLMTCTKVMIITLPLWYLYKHYGEDSTSQALRPAAFDILFFASTIGVIRYTQVKVTPLLSLALSLSYLSWKIFASTRYGIELLDLE